ncbi:MAG TPA: hypothetical protein VFA12_18270, partial [Stellaceae bacterium]|nr:hypothetical protein [Stellaceae bacterium]
MSSTDETELLTAQVVVMARLDRPSAEAGDRRLAPGDDEEERSQVYRAGSGQLESSFPRKRESFLRSVGRPWTPAFAGVTEECNRAGSALRPQDQAFLRDDRARPQLRR